MDSTCESFLDQYQITNFNLWGQYERGEINKEVLRIKRFDDTLRFFGIKNIELAGKFGESYIKRSPKKTHLFPYTHNILNELKEKYTLHIITNGFEEVQHIKLSESDLTKYFQTVVTSESAGSKKPSIGIFNFALKNANAHKLESLMIGDNLQSDVKGAMKAGIDQVFFNPTEKKHKIKCTHEILCLSDLRKIL